MEQKIFSALTAMLNAFPQTANDKELTLRTFEAALRGVSSQAVAEAAERYIKGDVPEQSLTFAPSIAEFVKQAKFVDGVIPMRNRPRLVHDREWKPQEDPATRARMGFKMNVLSAGIAHNAVGRVSKANERGLEEMVALAQEWGVTVPDEVWRQLGKAA